MIFKFTTLIFISISIAVFRPIKASAKCKHTCGSMQVLYPFGFSSGCPIPLNCTSQNEILIGNFPIQSVNPDNILLTIQAQCDRPIHSFHHLFSMNYAPTSQNAILLHNCSSSISSCILPKTMVKTHFETLGCGSSSNISCYSAVNESFMSYGNLKRNRCTHLLSSISAESLNSTGVSLEVQVIRLGWWLQGSCDLHQCDKDAFCTQIMSPIGQQGFRCRCKNGLFGDGFKNGMGCRKVSSACGIGNYMSGRCGGRSSLAVLIGGIATGASLMIILGLLCCFVRRRSKLKIKHNVKRRLSEATGECQIHVYSYKEIEKATDSFSNKHLLGTGAYATVYAGKLHNNEWVAIKRIKQRNESVQQVVNEIKLLSSVSHPNLVRLIGCCIENDEQILVYEFMPNGTLCEHLQRERGEGLSWPIRLTIASETAQAIAHLHSAIDPPIYHRDIKSSNILLDYNFRSKVADFGLSRLGRAEISHISTAPQGTPGYLDPQYHQNFQLSDKSDVYSFGVVLVEIITAMKVVDFARPQNEVNLAALAIDRIGKGRLEEIIDPFLEANRHEWTIVSIRKVAELAFRCLAFDRDMRPSMMEVAAELHHTILSKWATFEGGNCNTQYFSGLSSCSFSSSSFNASEKPLNMGLEKGELESKGLLFLENGANSIVSIDSMERTKDGSPVSVQDPWTSEQSSPSSDSLLSNIIQ